MLKGMAMGLLMVALSWQTAQAAMGLSYNPTRLPKPPAELSTESFSHGVWRLAQVDPQASTKYTSAKGMIEGEMMGENIGTGGNFAVGFLVGAVTGILGSGIGYFVIGPASMNAQARHRIEGKGDDYYLGFKNAWDKKTRSRKRNAFLGGGVLGWLAFLAIYYG